MRNKLKKLQKIDRREQIIQESINIIDKNGISGLSIRELASKCKITEGAIYKHFKSKNEIIEGIFGKIHETSKSLFMELDKTERIQEKLRKFIFFHLDLFEKKPELVSIMFSDEIFANNNELVKKLLNIKKQRQTLLSNLLKSGIDNKIFKDFDNNIISKMIQGYLRITITGWRNSGYDFSLIKQGEKFYKTLEDILLIKR